jgi:hypothetical protein
MLEDKITPVKMLDYALFRATRTVPTAYAYLFPPSLKIPLEKLHAHGIAVEQLTAPLTTDVNCFQVSEIKKSPRAFQKHNEIRLTGNFQPQTITFPKGTIVVRTAQRLGLLAAYLLEPESDDGLVTWNYFDSSVEVGKPFPVFKLMHTANLPAQLMESPSDSMSETTPSSPHSTPSQDHETFHPE